MKKVWWICPICGQKLLVIDSTKEINGVYIKCKKCHNEVEVINIAHVPKPEPVPA